MPLAMRERALRLPVGADGGVAGSAAATSCLVVAEVPADPRTTPFRALAAQFGVRSAWTSGLDLGLDVVAEGVETGEQRAALTALGCPRAQGFLLGRPVPVADLHAPR